MILPPALVQRFTAHLAGLRDEVSALEPGLASPAPSGADARERLRTLSHQLAGTAEGYGFPAVGARARDVETALSAADSALCDHVRRLGAALADAVDGQAI